MAGFDLSTIPIVGDFLSGPNGLLIGIFAVLLIVGLVKGAKSKGMGRAFIWIGGIGLGVFLLLPMLTGGTGGFDLGGLLGGLGGTDAPAAIVTTEPASSSSVICAVEDTTVTLAALNKYTQVSTGGAHRYRVNGASPSTVADAGTLTASPGDKIEVLWYNASTSGNYYSDLNTYTIPCKGTYSPPKELFQNMSTVTIQVFNEEGNVIDGGVENETLAAGDVVTLPIKFTGQYQRGLPYGLVVVAEWNSTEIDDVIVNLGGSEVSVPQIESVAAANRAKAYSVPAILSNQILEGSVTIDSDDTINPADGGGDITLTFYANNYYVNEDNGASVEGPAVEDEDDTRTGLVVSYANTVSID